MITPLLSQSISLLFGSTTSFFRAKGQMTMQSYVRSMFAVLSAGLILALSSQARAISLPDSSTCPTNGNCLTITNTSTVTGIGVAGIAKYVGTGVYGATASGYGVTGYATSGSGVQGSSSNGTGVNAVSLAGGHGVHGETHTPQYAGVWGNNTTASGSGVLGSNTGSGVGVAGDNLDPSGWAGYFRGNVFATGTYQGSDERLKTDIKEAPYGLSQLGKLRPVTYHWKKGDTATTQLGLIAQEVQKVIPEIVHADGTTGMLAVNYTSLIPVLIKAVQQQQAIIVRQETAIASQDARIASLEARRPQASAPSGLPAAAVALCCLPFGLLIPRKRKQQ
jgi:hypothetical protein